MFRIGEFSKLTQVTIRMLRYYDEMGLLKPSKIDPRTNYRMYSVEQIPTLNKIIYLRMGIIFIFALFSNIICLHIYHDYGCFKLFHMITSHIPR